MSTVLPTAGRVAVVLLAGAVALLAGAAPAWAHTELESSTPAADARVAQAPTEVTLTFTEDVPADRAEVTVTGPAGTDAATGTDHASGPITAAGGTLTVPLEPLGDAGVYEIEYRVVSDDGHPVSGTVPFTLTAPGPGAGAPAPTPAAPAGAPDTTPAPAGDPAADSGTDSASGDTAGTGMPVWPWLLVAVVVLGGGAALALRRTRN